AKPRVGAGEQPMPFAVHKCHSARSHRIKAGGKIIAPFIRICHTEYYRFTPISPIVAVPVDETRDCAEAAVTKLKDIAPQRLRAPQKFRRDIVAEIVVEAREDPAEAFLATVLVAPYRNCPER